MEFTIDAGGMQKIFDAAGELLVERAEAIAQACNDDSTWGGYHAVVDEDRQSARVYSADGRNDEARDQRLLRNLDAGA